jgi:phage terminase large subunit
LIILNNKFAPLFDSPTRYFVITGGRGSSKSFNIGAFTLGLSFETNHKILYTRSTMKSAHLSIIPEFNDKIKRIDAEHIFDINKTEIENKITGSQIIFSGIKTSSGDQTANLKSLQGITTWIIDEAEELTIEEKFDDIDLSIRDNARQNRVILILNPATKEHWIYKRFYQDAGVPEGFSGIKGDVTYIHTTYLDNIEHLPEKYVQSLNEMKFKRPEKYKHKILGGWLDKAEGIIFNNWQIGQFNYSIPSIFGQDFGFSIDPTTLIETAIDKSSKKIYLKEHLCKEALTTSEIYNINKRVAGNKLIIGDSAEPRLIHEVATKGCNIKAVKKGKDSIIAGISLMLDYDLVIDEGSINLIRELNNYVWHDKKSQTPIDAFNHCIDAARYAIYYQLLNPNKGNYAIR